MGLFNLFGKREKEEKPARVSDDGDEWVTIEVRKSELDAFNELMGAVKAFGTSPEREEERRKINEEIDRQQREYEEQQRRRMKALKEQGVAVDCITLDKCRAEAFDIAKTLCGVDLASLGPCEREVVSWQQLTKTGKAPKCVANYSTNWSLWNDRGFSEGAVVCEVGYLADGTPYTAWVNDLRGSGTFYKIKTVDGKLALIAANPA